MAVVLFIIDGLGDRPQNVKVGRKTETGTPLELARKPNLDYLAKNGQTGLMITHGKGIKPESEDAHLRIFGYDPGKYMKGRGPLEALGAGLDLLPGDVAFRSNFAYAEEGKYGLNGFKIIDRRAGRISTKEAHAIAKNIGLGSLKFDNVEFIFKPTVEHRGVLVMKPESNVKLSYNITGNDQSHYDIPGPVALPLDASAEAKRTVDLLNKYIMVTHDLLKKDKANIQRAKKGLPQANFILVRGPGIYSLVPPIKEKYGLKAACVAGAALYKGAAKFVGMDVYDVKGATGDKNTNLKAKIRKVEQLLKLNMKSKFKGHKRYDLIFLHVKAADAFSHDKDFLGKMKFIEKIDRAIGPDLKRIAKEHNIIILGDHTTPCSIGDHTDDPIPVLVVGKNVVLGKSKPATQFGEKWCAKGQLGTIYGKDVIGLIQKLSSDIKKSL